MKAKAPLPGPGATEMSKSTATTWPLASDWGPCLRSVSGPGSAWSINRKSNRSSTVMSSFHRPALRLRPIPRSPWRDLSRFPVITSSTTNGRCWGQSVGKTGVSLKMSTFQPIVDQGIFRATGTIPGNLRPVCIYRPVEKWLLQLGFSLRHLSGRQRGSHAGYAHRSADPLCHRGSV